MLARTTVLKLPGDVQLATPVLIPSISSRGFQREDGTYECADLLELVVEAGAEVVLVSAFDVHSNILPQIPDENAWGSVYTGPRVLYLDSGGFELLGQDLSNDDASHEPQFDREAHLALLASLPSQLSTLAVSYDHYGIGSKPSVHSPDRSRVATLRL